MSGPGVARSGVENLEGEDSCFGGFKEALPVVGLLPLLGPEPPVNRAFSGKPVPNPAGNAPLGVEEVWGVGSNAECGLKGIGRVSLAALID